MAARLRSRTWRDLRLATGLVLFAYVATHLLNHALGNVSLAAMEEGLGWVFLVWLGPVGRTLLYGSLAVHVALGLASLYGRRTLRMRPAEAAQLVLGLAIPLVLINHVANTRLAIQLLDLDRGYPPILHSLFVESPGGGLVQATFLVVAWAHGCLGLYFWLRLKAVFPRLAPLLLSLAVLVPVLALLGFLQGGRAVAALAADPAWQAQNLGPAQVGSAEQKALIGEMRMRGLVAYAAALLVVLGARVVRRHRRRGLVALSYPDGRTVRVARGLSVLDASRLNGIPHASVCGGKGRCSTCRVRVAGPGATSLPAPGRTERAVLDRLGARPGVRLACQLRPTGDLTVVPLLPSRTDMRSARLRDAATSGEERFVVAVFVDMRGSTRLAEAHLPFDTVFIISRFLSSVARAVAEAGGTPNQFLGDGLLALFGLVVERDDAARQALAAVEGIVSAVAALNDAMAAELDRPIGYGIGVHAGTAIVGEIGDGEHTAFTAIGDPVNVASRLQDLTKSLACRAVVSEAVYEAAGVPPEGTAHTVTVRGASGELAVRLLHAVSEEWATQSA